jgi:muramoyltetrapeptide carboxypeptidase
MEKPSIHVFEPSGPPEDEVLERNLQALRIAGFEVDYTPLQINARGRLQGDGVRARLEKVHSALKGAHRYLLSARGGYGVSELMSQLDWQALAQNPAKVLIGFSDVSALQSAFFTRLGWPSLHAPMPGSPLWQGGADVVELMDLLSAKRPWRGEFEVAPLGEPADIEYQGVLFGGCLSVLSNLVGTPNLPSDLSGHVLFFEDTGESAPRLLRYWRQWLDSGLLKGVTAVVFGRFTHMGSAVDAEAWVLSELAARTPCPVFSSCDFGHVTPNRPIALGAKAKIEGNRLAWRLEN